MRVVANGLGIEVDDQGPANGEPLLLVMGLGMQLLGWPDELVHSLVQRGFRVIRFDNRDVGLSQGFESAGVPRLAVEAARFLMRLPVRAPYSLKDMAADCVGVLDALGIPAAHVCGASMGGMVAQHLAIRHPTRVKSLTLIFTTTGSRSLPQPGWPVRRALLGRPASPEAAVAHLQKVMAIIGSPAYPPEPTLLRQRLQTSVQRAWRPDGTARQMVAILADGDRSVLVRNIQRPTHVIHGLADPLIPVAAGEELAQLIPGATVDLIPGMGHDLPQPLLARLAEGIAQNAKRAV